MAAIIIYFSRADENYFGGVRRYIETGNTEVIAGMIQKLTGADIFKIEPLHSYSAEYDSCIYGSSVYDAEKMVKSWI